MILNYQWMVDPALAKLFVGLFVSAVDANDNEVREYIRGITADTGDPIPPNNGSVIYSEAITL